MCIFRYNRIGFNQRGNYGTEIEWTRQNLGPIIGWAFFPKIELHLSIGFGKIRSFPTQKDIPWLKKVYKVQMYTFFSLAYLFCVGKERIFQDLLTGAVRCSFIDCLCSLASFTCWLWQVLCCSCLVVAQKVCRIKFPAELEEGAGEYRKDPFPQQKFVPKSSQSLGRKVLMLRAAVPSFYSSSTHSTSAPSPEKLPFPGISKPQISKLVRRSTEIQANILYQLQIRHLHRDM